MERTRKQERKMGTVTLHEFVIEVRGEPLFDFADTEVFAAGVICDLVAVNFAGGEIFAKSVPGYLSNFARPQFL